MMYQAILKEFTDLDVEPELDIPIIAIMRSLRYWSRLKFFVDVPFDGYI